MADKKTILVKILAQARQPVHLWGLPGEGKTQLARIIADQFGWRQHTEILSIADPVDIGGVMQLDGSRTPPAWARDLAEHAPSAMLFFDELTCCPPALQAAALRICLERVVGGFPLGDIAVMAASNPEGIAAGDGDMLSPPLANRFAHLDWQLPDEAHSDYLAGGPGLAADCPTLPSDWRDHIPRWSTQIAAFLTAVPGMRRMEESQITGQFDDDSRAPAARSTFPTPRAWSDVARCLAAVDSVGLIDALMIDTVQAVVGEDCAISFAEWMRSNRLPTGREVLDDPRWDRSWRPDEAIAIITACCRETQTEADWRQLTKVVALAVEHNKEAAITCLSNIKEARRDKTWPPMSCLAELLPFLD